MPCLKNANPFEPATFVRCPCEGGCAGTLKSDGRNVLNTNTLLECDVCSCGYVAEDSESTRPVETCRTQLAEALGLDLTGDMDWTWAELLDVVRQESQQLAKVRGMFV